MTSPLLLDQLAASHRVELEVSARAHRTARAARPARPSLAPSLRATFGRLAAHAPRPSQATQVCCA